MTPPPRGLPSHLDANPIDCFIQTSCEFILTGVEGLEGCQGAPLSMVRSAGLDILRLSDYHTGISGVISHIQMTELILDFLGLCGTLW